MQIKSLNSTHDSLKTSHCFIIAEAGVNHNGSLEIARKLIDIATDVGADAMTP